MPKLKKYEIEAVTRQIQMELVKTRTKISNADVLEQYESKHVDEIREYVKVCNDIDVLYVRKRELENSQNLANYGVTKTELQYREDKIQEIRKALTPEVNAEIISDLVIVHSNLALKDIIAIVVRTLNV
jgi:hypothetical protein